MAEIKELKEKQQKEDDVLLAFAAGNRQPVVPHLIYEYSDENIHEDVFKLVQYSCEEVCSTKEQLNKVMRFWTTFLEPMLGIVSRPNGPESSEDDGKVRHPVMNYSSSSIAENGGSPGAVPAVLNSKQPKSASNGDENTSPDLANFCRVIVANGDSSAKQDSLHELDRVCKDDPACNTLRLEKEQKDIDMTDRMSGFNIQVTSGQGVADSKTSFIIGAEPSQGRTSICGIAGLFWISS